MSNCNNQETMPVAIGPLLGAGLGALQQGKIDRALSGDKVYTKPKTIFGKLIGGVTGRSAAAEASASVKTAPIDERTYNALGPNTAPQNMNANKTTPLTGGISFGGEATKKTYLPFAIVAAVIAVFYFMRKKGRGRRR
jgi:hypothetical protein